MKILIVDQVHPILTERLEEKGHHPEYRPSIGPDEIRRSIGDYQGLVIRSKMHIDRELIDRAGQLQFIVRMGSGMENIDFPYAHSRDIACMNTPEGNRDAVGEHALGLLLGLMNRMGAASQEVKSGIWKREANRGTELKGKTIGIIGFGNTGSAFARKISGLDCHILACDKYKFNYGGHHVKETTMKNIFDQADVLSLHVPLTQETRYLVNNNFMEKFRKPIALINTSRGAVVNTSHLVDNLHKGKVLAAGLDVLEYESSTFEELHQNQDLPGHLRELADMDQVMLTPHVAGWTHESYYRLSEIAAIKILRYTGQTTP